MLELVIKYLNEYRELKAFRLFTEILFDTQEAEYQVSQVSDFLDWLDNPINKLNVQDIVHWLFHLIETNVGETDRLAKYQCLIIFLMFCEARNVVDTNSIFYEIELIVNGEKKLIRGGYNDGN